jgi:hypothetical protein
MSDFKINRLNAFLELINSTSEESYTDQHKRIYKNYKAYKIPDLTRFIYNNSNSKNLEALKHIELTEIQI